MVSAFESNDRETGLIVLLRSARLGGVSVESLIDDALQLPQRRVAS